MSAPPTAIDYTPAVLPSERYGLRLAEDTTAAAPGACGPYEGRPMRPFDWGLLAGLAAVQLAHLAGLVVLARWLVQRTIGL